MFSSFRWILLFLLIIGTTSLFLGNIKVNKEETLSSFKTGLNHFIQRDSTIIHRFFNSDDDLVVLQELENSPLSVEVYQRDSIIYWNEAAFAIQTASFNVTKPNTSVEASGLDSNDLLFAFIPIGNQKAEACITLKRCDVTTRGMGGFFIQLNQSKTCN